MFGIFPKSKAVKPSVFGSKGPDISSFSQTINQQVSGFSVRGAVDSVAGSVSNAVGSVAGDPLGAIERVASGNVRSLVNKAFIPSGSFGGSQREAEQVLGEFGSKSVLPSVAPGGDASQWGQINPNLLANIYLLRDGVPDDSAGVIKAPISDANLDIQLNWQSPFEGAGPESKAPALMALIQSGQIGIITQSLQAVLPNGDAQGGVVDRTIADASGYLGQVAQKTKDFAKSLEGRTGITKLNSRQVFSGMPPISITFTLHLRAFQDPIKEVMEPYQALLEWALPEQLAQDGIIANTAGAVSGDQSIINALFPSKAPSFVGFRYADNRYEPMVIESVGHPLDGPMDSRGFPLYRAIQIKLSTLTALDRSDIKNVLLR